MRKVTMGQKWTSDFYYSLTESVEMLSLFLVICLIKFVTFVDYLNFSRVNIKFDNLTLKRLAFSCSFLRQKRRKSNYSISIIFALFRHFFARHWQTCANLILHFNMWCVVLNLNYFFFLVTKLFGRYRRGIWCNLGNESPYLHRCQ